MNVKLSIQLRWFINDLLIKILYISNFPIVFTKPRELRVIQEKLILLA